MKNAKTRWRAIERANIYYGMPALQTRINAEKLWRSIYYNRPHNFRVTGFNEIDGQEMPNINTEENYLKVLILGSRALSSLDELRMAYISETRYEQQAKTLGILIDKSDIDELKLMQGKKRSMVSNILKSAKRLTKSENSFSLVMFQRLTVIGQKLSNHEKLTDTELKYVIKLVDKL